MILILIGLFISFVYSILILPNNEGSEPIINPTIYPFLYKGMIIVPYDKVNAIHFHHWVFYFLILAISFVIYIPKIIIGFSLGLLIQGIIYKDSTNFIIDNPYNKL